MMSRLGVASLFLGLAAIGGACAEERAEPLQGALESMVWRTHPQGGLELNAKAAHRLVAVDGRREGSALALATISSAKRPAGVSKTNVDKAQPPIERVLLIADEDAAAVRLLDAKTHRQIAIAPLRGRPSQLLVASDGRAYVALRDHQRVVALELQSGAEANESASSKAGSGKPVSSAAGSTATTAFTLKEVRDYPTAAEPVGLAMSPDGDTLLVVSGWGRQLQAFSLLQGHKRFSLRLPREPRAVTTSADGQYAFVSHAVGSALTRVELTKKAHNKTALLVGGTDVAPPPRPKHPWRHPLRDFPPEREVSFRGIGDAGGQARHAIQGFALAAIDERILSPLVLVHPGERAVGGYGTSVQFPAHQAALAVASNNGDTLRIRVETMSFAASQRRTHPGDLNATKCLLPRSIAVDAKRQVALVSCLGRGVLVYQLADKSLIKSALAHWKVPAGPVGIAVDSGAGNAYVWSQFAQAVSTITLPPLPQDQHPSKTFRTMPKTQSPLQVTAMPKTKRSEGAPAAISELARRGRELFHAVGDTRLSGDGRACASCHPDGREDGISWPTPQGRSQTPMLAGRLGPDTAPYGWNGESDSVVKHVSHTFKRLGGRGLKNHDLDALMAYLQEMPAPPKALALVADDKEMAQREQRINAGKELFNSELVGCATCHKQGDGTDGARHNVGSGRELDTPALRYLAGTAPYFHDGRYATLMEMLRATKGKMGWGSDLDEEQLESLNAYLLTL